MTAMNETMTAFMTHLMITSDGDDIDDDNYDNDNYNYCLEYL